MDIITQHLLLRETTELIQELIAATKTLECDPAIRNMAKRLETLNNEHGRVRLIRKEQLNSRAAARADALAGYLLQ